MLLISSVKEYGMAVVEVTESATCRSDVFAPFTLCPKLTCFCFHIIELLVSVPGCILFTLYVLRQFYTKISCVFEINLWSFCSFCFVTACFNLMGLTFSKLKI